VRTELVVFVTPRILNSAGNVSSTGLAPSDVAPTP
jgi:hypothetical protein